MSKNSMKLLDDEQLEKATGGYLFYYAAAPGDADWEVLDDRGERSLSPRNVCPGIVLCENVRV